MENLNPSNILVMLNLVVLVGGILSGFIVVRSSLERGAQAIQERVQVALKDENEGLQRRLERMEEDSALCKRQAALVVEVMRQHGLILEINGEMVSVRDAQGRTFGRTPKRPQPNKPKDTA